MLFQETLSTHTQNLSPLLPSPYVSIFHTFLNSDNSVDLPPKSNSLWGLEQHPAQLWSDKNPYSSAQKSPQLPRQWTVLSRGCAKKTPPSGCSPQCLSCVRSHAIFRWVIVKSGNVFSNDKKKNRTFCWEREKCHSTRKEMQLFKTIFSLKNQEPVS